MTYKDYNPFSSAAPTIKEFQEEFQKIAEECSVDGININSHKIKTSVQVVCENSDDEFEIVGMGVGMLFGCGCWSDPKIIIRKING